jgi:hypothetical protein
MPTEPPINTDGFTSLLIITCPAFQERQMQFRHDNRCLRKMLHLQPVLKTQQAATQPTMHLLNSPAGPEQCSCTQYTTYNLHKQYDSLPSSSKDRLSPPLKQGPTLSPAQARTRHQSRRSRDLLPLLHYLVPGRVNRWSLKITVPCIVWHKSRCISIFHLTALLQM